MEGRNEPIFFTFPTLPPLESPQMHWTQSRQNLGLDCALGGRGWGGRKANFLQQCLKYNER